MELSFLKRRGTMNREFWEVGGWRKTHDFVMHDYFWVMFQYIHFIKDKRIGL